MSEPLPDDLAAALAASAGRRGAFGSRSSSSRDRLDQRRRGGWPSAARPKAPSSSPRADGGPRPPRPRVVLAAGRRPLRLGRRAAIRRVAPLLTLAGGVAVAEGIRAATGLPVADQVAERHRRRGRACTGPPPQARRHPRRRRRPARAACSTSCSASASTCARPPTRRSWPRASRRSNTSSGAPVDAGAGPGRVLVALNEQWTRSKPDDVEQVLTRWRALAPSASGTTCRWNADGVTRAGHDSRHRSGRRAAGRTGPDSNGSSAGEVSWTTRDSRVADSATGERTRDRDQRLGD